MHLFKVDDIVQIRGGYIGIVSKLRTRQMYSTLYYYEVRYVHRKRILQQVWSEDYLVKLETISAKTLYVWLTYGLI